MQLVDKELPTLGSVAALLAALYQGHHDSNYKLWNIGSTEKYVLHMQVLLKCCYIKMMESSQWENFVVKFRFLLE
jgi:hypothetical protein